MRKISSEPGFEPGAVEWEARMLCYADLMTDAAVGQLLLLMGRRRRRSSQTSAFASSFCRWLLKMIRNMEISLLVTT